MRGEELCDVEGRKGGRPPGGRRGLLERKGQLRSAEGGSSRRTALSGSHDKGVPSIGNDRKKGKETFNYGWKGKRKINLS